VLKHQNTISHPCYYHFGFSQIGISGLAITRDLTLRYLGCQNTKKPYLIYAIIILGFHKSGFWDWRLQEILPLGIPSAETPKYQNFEGTILSGARSPGLGHKILQWILG
jgi:hypothetical protein